MCEDITITLIGTCPICGKDWEVEVKSSDYMRYMSGAYVQDAFPYLSANERELLISGICGECYDAMWLDDGR